MFLAFKEKKNKRKRFGKYSLMMGAAMGNNPDMMFFEDDLEINPSYTRGGRRVGRGMA